MWNFLLYFWVIIHTHTCMECTLLCSFQVRVRDSRERTVEARQGVDGVTLQLQNLLYEVAHLKKDVRRCLDFQSADQEIDLVPVDQFYVEAPEDISRPVSRTIFYIAYIGTMYSMCI